jgi:hypothetical protein
MYLTHLETKIWRGTFHIYFKKWFVWPFEHYEKTFFVNFERYDLPNGEE